MKFSLESKKFVPDSSRQYSPDTTALDIGVSAHKYAEILTVSPGVDRNIAASSSESGLPLTADSKEKLVKLRVAVDNFENRVNNLKAQGRVIFDNAELKAAVNKNMQPVDFFSRDCALRGKIDRAIMLEKADGGRHIIAIDYKTGKYKEGDERYSLQLETYGVLLHTVHRDAVSVQPYLYFLEEEKLVGHSRKIYKADINQDNPVFKALNNATEEYSAAETPEKKVGKQCDWCKYKLHCQS
jgi:CRISPR/Cas system-associated exonuclease Cas4 (RecB family)